MTVNRDTLIAAARAAMDGAYAPYSNFHVGAALAFDDGSLVTGANAENASYGMTLCAETVAVGKALNEGKRGGLIGIAVVGGMGGTITDPVTPCGRCRQMLNELAQLGGTDPVVWCAGDTQTLEERLSALLPKAFGPASLG